MTVPSTAYETWVKAVRTWRQDPRHDLTTLPPLAVDSLPPAAYDRLFAHIRDAQQHVMDRWSATFARQWADAKDDHGRIRLLIDTRVLLARRLQLAGHPGLPDMVRKEFTAGVARDIQTLQKNLEDTAAARSGHRIDRCGTEHTLSLLRANRLTAILDPGFPLQALLEGRLEVSESPPASPVTTPHDAAPPPPRPLQRKHRAIIIES